MEKHTSHYLLIEIQAQMTTVQKMNLTVSAITGIRKLGMSRAEALNDGVKTVTQDYKGYIFTSEIHGAFCNSCDEGFVEFDEAEETAWLDFRYPILLLIRLLK